MEANKKIKSYEPENFEENYKAYLVDLLSTNYKTLLLATQNPKNAKMRNNSELA